MGNVDEVKAEFTRGCNKPGPETWKQIVTKKQIGVFIAPSYSGRRSAEEGMREHSSKPTLLTCEQATANGTVRPGTISVTSAVVGQILRHWRKLPSRGVTCYHLANQEGATPSSDTWQHQF